ncbi:SNF2-related protein [Paraburkholderia sediminicola]|uniref:SNF2-related protein n=1 Tax=Paraburkholderia sediminicola TaxID=458836 RepID=UPI0038BC084D
MHTLILDDASNSMASDLSRLRLAKEAKTLLKERETLTSALADTLRALQIGKRIREIALALGLRPAAATPAPIAAPAVRTEPTAEFYPDEGRKTTTQRQKDNNAAIALLRRIQAGEVEVTDEERAVLAKYSGNGGGLTGADGLTGSPHEYYTPKPVASAMWDLLGELGFAGGTVCDPSAGSGIFTATRPKTAIMTQIELDETSGAINAAINDGPTVSTTVSPFEAIAAATPDEIYDAIITNVPFGDLAMRGDNAQKDKRFQKRNLQEYFILRSLQKLKPKGLAAFIVPPSIVGGKGAKSCKLRLEASLMAEFLGAYRLPNKIFTESAAADTITDVIVFRKFSRTTAQRIEELQQQNPSVLATARVLWPEFLDGLYFKGEGKKYVLGETAIGTGKFGEVEKVINEDSIGNIARLIKRFPHSHIDWELLNATETAPIIYADGDVIHSSGQTLEMRDGEWHALDSQVADDRHMLDLGQKVNSPLDVVNAGVTWEQAQAYIDYALKMGKYSDIQPWLTATSKAINTLGQGDMQPWFEAITAGMAAMDLLQADGLQVAQTFNYLEAYPVLSTQLAKCQAYGNKTIAKGSRLVKDALLSIRNVRYKGEFTPFWLGQIQANVETAQLTPTQLYEKVRYENEDETGFVSVEKLREAFSDFDPLESDEWCIAADGQSVMHANDYYSGTYSAFLKQAEADLEAATDPAIRAKIVRQMDAAKARVNVVDVSEMTFSLFTPHISNLHKLEFLKTYVSPDIFLTTDAEGRDVFDIKQASVNKYAPVEEKAAHKAMQRFVKGYLKNQNITTMSKSSDVSNDPDAESALLRRIKEIADKAKAQFDSWAHANEEIQAALHAKLNAPDALRFIEEPDGTPLDIPNLNTVSFKPHAYQYAAARRYSRHFGGVLGFDVGLGKTLTALATTQYAHSIGVKKKTVFVVPNATLTNWKKEAGKAYLETSDCLFVGVVKGKDGKDKVDNAQVKIDLNVIRENRHAKIFMTLEAFKLIPLREETMDAYVSYLTQNDDAYLLAEEEAQSKRANIAADSKAGKVKDLGVKSGALPFFEDLGVDSLVLDEAHNYKNSKMTSSEFKGAKYLADPTKSQRGMDMQAKAWYVRGLTPRNDGVISLTATPVTNSPLEVYSMLTLALGEAEVNNMYGVTGADSFMAGACDIEEREEENIVGQMRPVRVFTGLQNAQLLRRLLQTSAVIKTAEDVKADGINISVPDSELIATGVDIGEESYAKIIAYKDEYLDAVEAMKAGGATPEEKLKGSPFNLIRKMTRVINDPELDTGVIVFKFAAADFEGAQKAVGGFNKKNIKELRDYEDPNAAPEDVTVKVVKDTETGEAISKFIITVRSRINGSAIELLSTDFGTQEVLLKLLDANGITPGINVSPKLAALIDNVKKEAAYPRHAGHSKQIIFCDELSLHHKIKLAIAQEVGISPSKIKVVNAVSVDVAGMQDVQDGFNADGEENKYEYVVANKKAEVGINLQKGTQAIHHMTIGWTPDSIHQRNGRGVRQGNPIDRVNEYHYDADGTFDAYKRKLVGIKADWIGALMKGDSGKIKIEGDMTAADYELLASAVGDAGAMDRINEEITARNRREKIAATKVRQLQDIRIIEGAGQWLAKFGLGDEDDERKGFNQWVNTKIVGITTVRAQIAALEDRAGKTESTLMHSRLSKQVAELSGKLSVQLAVLGGLATPGRVPSARSVWEPISDEERATDAYANWKKDLTIQSRMRDESAKSFVTRADEGYSAESLEAFQKGEAQIVTGVLVALGSFVEFENQLLVVTKGTKRGGTTGDLYGFNPATQKDHELLRMAKPVFTERGTSGWMALVQRAAALDEAVIADNADEGFYANDPRLFMSYVSDVREAITVPVPSDALSRSSFTFRRPYFPLALEDNPVGGPLIDKIKAEQDALLAPSSRYNAVKPRDMRDVGPAMAYDVKARAAAIREYCITHGLRASAQDLMSISANLSMRQIVSDLGLSDAFFKALPSGVAASKSPEELDAWAFQWFADNSDWLDVRDLDSALGYEAAAYRRTQNKIDDGRERWLAIRDDIKWAIGDDATRALQAAIESGLLVDEITGEAGSIAYPSAYMPQGFLASGAGRKLAELVFADTGEYIELKTGVDKVRASMGVSNNVRLYVQNWADAGSIVLAIFSSKWASMIGWAKKAKAVRAMDSAGTDVPGMLAAILRVPGILSATVGTADVREKRYGTIASYTYLTGTYILLGIVRGSSLFDKIATKGDAGLQGRTFDKETKCFRVTIPSGETFSDGVPVASVDSLFKHIGLNIADYKL